MMKHTSTRTIREAHPSDMPAIMEVIRAAKAIMRASGNYEQWAGDYPSEAVITSDINSNGAFVVIDDGQVMAYFAFLPSPEPTYSTIYDGKWLDDALPYHVIHRMASYPHVHGIFSSIMDYCFSRESNIRIDTHRDNTIMQHNILKHGFTYCGIIYLQRVDEAHRSSAPTSIIRLAYQKITALPNSQTPHSSF